MFEISRRHVLLGGALSWPDDHVVDVITCRGDRINRGRDIPYMRDISRSYDVGRNSK